MKAEIYHSVHPNRRNESDKSHSKELSTQEMNHVSFSPFMLIGSRIEHWCSQNFTENDVIINVITNISRVPYISFCTSLVKSFQKNSKYYVYQLYCYILFASFIRIIIFFIFYHLSFSLALGKKYGTNSDDGT